MNRVTFPMLILGLSLVPTLCGAAGPTDQAKAAEIEKLGGKVTVDEKSPGKPVIGVNSGDTKVPLRKAVKDFNDRAAKDEIGKTQPLLTEEEVVAAIRWVILGGDKLPVSDKTYKTLVGIPDSRELPQGFKLEVLTSFIPNDQGVFAAWSVLLRIPREPDGTHAIEVRQRWIGSRLLSEEEKKLVHLWQKEIYTSTTIHFNKDDEHRRKPKAGKPSVQSSPADKCNDEAEAVRTKATTAKGADTPAKKPPVVSDSPRLQKERKTFVPFATFESSGGYGGIGGGTLQTGFTFVKLNEDPKAHRTSMAISLAYDMPCKRMPTYRAVAVDKQGRTFVSEGGLVSGGGQKLGVITLICTFPLAEQDIDKVVIERLKE